ncbi:DDE-type integrase/transposase/recombinase [Streptomyces vinaceus]|uniref:DDE-type integrase/transposase/recombinase n=1 Tax=Streptomyces vinaceus TaxID=1960 RepID=UPI00369A9BF6
MGTLAGQRTGPLSTSGRVLLLNAGRGHPAVGTPPRAAAGLRQQLIRHCWGCGRPRHGGRGTLVWPTAVSLGKPGVVQDPPTGPRAGLDTGGRRGRPIRAGSPPWSATAPDICCRTGSARWSVTHAADPRVRPVHEVGHRRRHRRPHPAVQLRRRRRAWGVIFSGGINGVRKYLRRAVDARGNVLDILIRDRRDNACARRFFRRLLTTTGTVPRVIVTDKLRFCDAAHGEVMLSVEHRSYKGLNHRARTLASRRDSGNARSRVSAAGAPRSGSCPRDLARIRPHRHLMAAVRCRCEMRIGLHPLESRHRRHRPARHSLNRTSHRARHVLKTTSHRCGNANRRAPHQCLYGPDPWECRLGRRGCQLRRHR